GLGGGLNLNGAPPVGGSPPGGLGLPGLQLNPIGQPPAGLPGQEPINEGTAGEDSSNSGGSALPAPGGLSGPPTLNFD
ncbi:MAG: hypothetical protein AAGI92_11895, partial [Pseudomonadota bacterium]